MILKYSVFEVICKLFIIPASNNQAIILKPLFLEHAIGTL